jgi:hypothetical protein
LSPIIATDLPIFRVVCRRQLPLSAAAMPAAASSERRAYAKASSMPIFDAASVASAARARAFRCPLFDAPDARRDARRPVSATLLTPLFLVFDVASAMPPLRHAEARFLRAPPAAADDRFADDADYFPICFRAPLFCLIDIIFATLDARRYHAFPSFIMPSSLPADSRRYRLFRHYLLLPPVISPQMPG